MLSSRYTEYIDKKTSRCITDNFQVVEVSKDSIIQEWVMRSLTHATEIKRGNLVKTNQIIIRLGIHNKMFKGVAAMWQTGVNLTYENNY